MTKRTLAEIARDIRNDWQNVNYAAKPYLEAMSEMKTVNDYYMFESAYSIVLRFLSNSATWKGETARRVKTELKALCTEAYKVR